MNEMVSVLITTYKRLAFLKKAVADVIGQTYSDWELVVSDDETDCGETWRWLCELAAQDKRIRVVKNSGRNHGQVFNVNNGLRNCRGDWIKPFFDDDRMAPNCLESMVAVVENFPSVVMVGCRAQRWRNGKYDGDEKDFTGGAVSVIRRDDCQRAILLYDRWNGRTPQHVMIRASAVRAGAVMPESVGYVFPVDMVWFAFILRHGDLLMMPEVLVEQHEGETVSLTEQAREQTVKLDDELKAAYKDIWLLADEKLRRAIPWRSVVAEINGIRGIYHLFHRRFLLGLGMLLRMLCSLSGTLHTLRWALQEMFPGRFAATRRLSGSALADYAAYPTVDLGR